ncbi:MAG: hypothetical protein FWF94_04810 [Oscillospiraceae bacterium]|nr:hypothetical protein [Oscillospiraceae bacterium]
MKYSELSKLNGKLGLVYNPNELTLTGTINGYNVIIRNDKPASELIMTVFCEQPIKTLELDFLPKNAIVSLNVEKSKISLYFSEYLMSQERLPLLLKTVDIVTKSQTGTPLPFDILAVNTTEMPEPPRKKFRLKKMFTVCVSVCITALTLILFFPTTIAHKILLALVASISIHVLYKNEIK